MTLVWRKSSYSNPSGGNCVEVASLWRKSTYSNGTGGNCLEVASPWRKSTHSNATGGNCIEVAEGSLPLVPVRDSKEIARGMLLVTADAWAEFTGSLK